MIFQYLRLYFFCVSNAVKAILLAYRNVSGSTNKRKAFFETESNANYHWPFEFVNTAIMQRTNFLIISFYFD
jgi:hypothetical protein